MGACLVNSAKEIVGTGCNRMPNGLKGKMQQTESRLDIGMVYSNTVLLTTVHRYMVG